MRPMTREQAIRRYQEEGRGRGEGSDYRPWLQAHDVPSRGSTFRMNGRKHRREHVLFSSIERNAFLAAQWLDHVVDIREQFPLWPYEDTEAIAADVGVNHPANPKGGVFVMTTDLLLTDADGSLSAIAVKPESELSRARVLEKLEIERLYWERRGVEWLIVTEREIPAGLAWNLNWVDECYEITPETLAPEQIRRTESYLLESLTEALDRPLNEVCAESDDRLGFKQGRCLSVVRHALARKRWLLPLDRQIDPGAPLPCPPVLAQAASHHATLAA